MNVVCTRQTARGRHDKRGRALSSDLIYLDIYAGLKPMSLYIMASGSSWLHECSIRIMTQWAYYIERRGVKYNIKPNPSCR